MHWPAEFRDTDSVEANAFRQSLSLFQCGDAMQKKSSDRLACLTPGDISAVIQMAWEDRTSFETIQERIGLTEPEVVRLMRSELNPSSFQLWRMRVKGRTTKHRRLRSPDMKFADHVVADHRRANC